MSKNGNGNGDERDNKGRFLPGMPGGPGRGNTRKKQERSEAVEEMKALLLDDNADLTSAKALAPVGRVLYYEIASENSKLSNDSKKLYLTWLGKMYEIQDREKTKNSLPSTEDLGNLTKAFGIKAALDCMEAEGETLCCDCMKKLALDDEGSKEND